MKTEFFGSFTDREKAKRTKQKHVRAFIKKSKLRGKTRYIVMKKTKG